MHASRLTMLVCIRMQNVIKYAAWFKSYGHFYLLLSDEQTDVSSAKSRTLNKTAMHAGG